MRDQREYAVTVRPVNPEEVELRPGEVLITKKTPVMDGGSRWEEADPATGNPLLGLGFAALLIGSLGTLAFANTRRR